MNIDKQSVEANEKKSLNKKNKDVNIYELISIILRRKMIIIALMVVGFFLSIFVTSLYGKVYQVETVLDIKIENLQRINDLVPGDPLFKSGDVLQRFKRNVGLQRYKKEFFDKYNIYERITGELLTEASVQDVSIVFYDFVRNISYAERSAPKNAGSLLIQFKGEDKKNIEVWLGEYISYLNEETLRQLMEVVQFKVKRKIQELKSEIKQKRLAYKQIRDREIHRLYEQHAIAEKLNIKNNLFFLFPQNELIKINDLTNSIKFLMSQISVHPDYVKGTEILQVEIDVLKQRVSDDVYIDGMFALQEKLSEYESVDYDKGDNQMFLVDDDLVLNIKSVSYNKSVFVFLSVVLSFFIGVLIVLLIEYRQMQIECGR